MQKWKESLQHWKEFFLTSKDLENALDYLRKASQVIEFVNLREEERTVALALEKVRLYMTLPYQMLIWTEKRRVLRKAIIMHKK